MMKSSQVYILQYIPDHFLHKSHEDIPNIPHEYLDPGTYSVTASKGGNNETTFSETERSLYQYLCYSTNISNREYD